MSDIINYKGVGKYRQTGDGSVEFESFHDIKDALGKWFNPIFERIYSGSTFTIKLKSKNEPNCEEYPYILECTPLFDRPLFVVSGGDITMNFEDIYGREPTIPEYLSMVQKIGGILNDFDRDFSEQNEEISDAIGAMAERGELPTPPTDEELEAIYEAQENEE